MKIYIKRIWEKLTNIEHGQRRYKNAHNRSLWGKIPELENRTNATNSSSRKLFEIKKIPNSALKRARCICDNIDLEWPTPKHSLAKLLDFREKEKKFFGHLATKIMLLKRERNLDYHQIFQQLHFMPEEKEVTF